MLLLLPLFNKTLKIEGWLDIEEADLLLSTTLRCCIELSQPHNLVEIGSYKGKSTVILGSVVRALFPDSKVYAIDPHMGIVGAEGQDLRVLESSLQMFNYNIEKEGLNDVVELIKECSFNVNWDKPISLLFIDGLHDYVNVSRDFNHFSKYLRIGGYIIFHDYAEYYPGVMKFVNELLKNRSYEKVYHLKSMFVVRYKG